MSLEAYPLQWPAGWPRVRTRQRARYKVSLAQARDELLSDLRRLHARGVVVSSNVPLRRDGLPLALQGSVDLPDPGVAVYWTDEKNRPRVIACDCWLGVDENLRAIGLAVGALRQLERCGASNILERAFEGFSALPSAIIPARHWRDVLGFSEATPLEEAIHAAYRIQARKCHPDTGGSHEAMIELNRAYEDALREIVETFE